MRRSRTDQTGRPQRPRGIDPTLARAGSVLVWVAAGLGFALLRRLADSDPLALTALSLAIFTPALAISLGLLVASATWSLSHETRELKGSVDALRRFLQEQDPALPPIPDMRSAGAPAADTPDALQPDTAVTASRTPAVPQASLAMTLRALHFPAHPQDAAGFAAMRHAFDNPHLAPLMRAAQDVLNRLAQEGIYMDDLHLDPIAPDTWRAVARGAGASSLARLPAIQDRSCLALTRAKLRDDPEFHDAADLFMRECAHVLASIVPLCEDATLTALTDTRSARAFVLLGDAAGVFPQP
ncbi:MAG: hypothetical protein ACXIU7_14275 [Roseinatronobacter sp.]